MSKIMLVKGPHRNLVSTVNKILPQQKVLFVALLSIACMSSAYAKPYSGNDPITNANWASYVPPSPLEMSSNSYRHSGIDEDIEDTLVKGSERDGVSHSYDELAGIGRNDNGPDEMENIAVGHTSPMDNASPADPRNPTNNVQQKGKFDMNPMELQRFLSQFYLIRTPYGYILGRVNPSISSSTISRRSMSTHKSRMKSAYEGVSNVDKKIIRKNGTPLTDFKLRVRKNNARDFQLRLKKNPNFQLRVRRQSPNFQLRVRKNPDFQLRVRKNPNFQLRVRKRDSRNGFQLRVRKDWPTFYDGETKRLPTRNFQLRVRKSYPDYEEMLPYEPSLFSYINEANNVMTRNQRSPTGFQLRVRKAPSNFQLRVRKDDRATAIPIDEEEELSYPHESNLNDYANTLPEIQLPGLLKLARKRSEGNFQLRV